MKTAQLKMSFSGMSPNENDNFFVVQGYEVIYHETGDVQNQRDNLLLQHNQYSALRAGLQFTSGLLCSVRAPFL